MSNASAITVEKIGKAYRLWDNPSSRLTAPLIETAARLVPGLPALKACLRSKATSLYRDFWALENISFQVGRGESMAIIGRNGSGKSTLLQIIAGTLQPSVGSIAVNGRVAALLELGSGFNPEFTGRENIHLNAALFGLSRAEIDAKFGEIVAFADIGDFIEQPVKIYSSGMVVRLAFAVAAHIEPNILIVDEALSVGDARFQLKCARAIDRFVAKGVTLLFVSHDTSMIKRLCKSAILLDQGKLIYSGDPNDVVNLYSKLIAEGSTVHDLTADIAELDKATIKKPKTIPLKAEKKNQELPAVSTGFVATPAELQRLQLKVKALETLMSAHPRGDELTKRYGQLLDDERLHVQLSGQEFSYGGTLGQILQAAMLDREQQSRTWFSTGEPIIVRMLVEAHEEFPEPIFALTIKNTAGVEIYGTNTLFSEQLSPRISIGSRREVDFAFDLNLMPGSYFISLGFTHFIGEDLVVIHRRYDTIKFDIHGKDRAFGIANLHAVITSRAIASPA